MNFSDSPESEVHLEPSETYTMERKSNIDIWEGYKYASAESLVKDILLYFFFFFFRNILGLYGFIWFRFRLLGISHY